MSKYQPTVALFKTVLVNRFEYELAAVYVVCGVYIDICLELCDPKRCPEGTFEVYRVGRCSDT
jgi:hypothetical protein